VTAAGFSGRVPRRKQTTHADRSHGAADMVTDAVSEDAGARKQTMPRYVK
jgi:hypothetical protein